MNFRIAVTALALSVSLFGGYAHPQGPQSPITYVGHTWETGGFLPSVEGDTLNMVAAIDRIDSAFGVDLLSNELTLWATGLVSTGAQDIGSGSIAITYTGGSFELWLDSTMDHDFGIEPPNATVPSTFRNGALFLGGVFASFVMFFDTNRGSGAYEGFPHFTEGTALELVEDALGSGWPIFGGVLDTAATGGTPPQGYDLQLDGTIEAIIEAVESRNWSDVKHLYKDGNPTRR